MDDTASQSDAMAAAGVNEVLHSLVVDGIFSGVGGVLSFLPIIVTLFFFCRFWRTAVIWQELRLLWISFCVNSACPAQYRSDADRVRVYSSRRDGQPDTVVRERPEDDYFTDTVYELYSKAADLCVLYSGVFPRSGSSRYDRIVCVRDCRRHTDGAYF